VAVGEMQEQPFELSFNSRLRVDFRGSRVTSDSGLLLVRELDERLGFGELIERHLTDARGKNTQLPLTDLVRQSVYSRLAGYKDVNDAERLSQDPAFRLIGSKKVMERGVALTSRLQSFETEPLTQAANLAGLAALNRELIAKGEAINSAAGGAGYGQHRKSRVTAARNKAPTTETSSRTATILCCCATGKATLGGKTGPGQCAQRRRLEGTAVARDRPAAYSGRAGRKRLR